MSSAGGRLFVLAVSAICMAIGGGISLFFGQADFGVGIAAGGLVGMILSACLIPVMNRYLRRSDRHK